MSWRLPAILTFGLFFAIAPLTSADSRGDHPRTAVIVLENREFDEVVGPPEAPYFNHLVERGALATHFYGLLHPSMPNYLGLLAGSTFGLTDDCTDCMARGVQSRNPARRRQCVLARLHGRYADPLLHGGRGRGIRQTTQPIHVLPVDHRAASTLQPGGSRTLAAQGPCRQRTSRIRLDRSGPLRQRSRLLDGRCRRLSEATGARRSFATSGPMGPSRSHTTREPATPVAVGSPPEGASRLCWSAPASGPASGSPISTRSTPCWRRSRTASTYPGFEMPGTNQR